MVIILRLSELQNKEIIDISTGKRVGNIIDASINTDGTIERLILEERRNGKKILKGIKDEITIYWDKIVKIGDDTILINPNRKN